MPEQRIQRGLLLHITHYDPKWCPIKPMEGPFDLATALAVVEAMGQANMDTLIVDIADGVKYASHPELQRHYTVPMSDLAQLAEASHAAGVDIVPKLNFAKSGRNLHDIWMYPHASQFLFTEGMDNYFRVAADLIGKLVDVCKPKHFFHLGMDEDHFRSIGQYVDAIERLRETLTGHGLRTMIWNDSCHDFPEEIAQVHAEKSMAAEPKLSKDIVHVLWHYKLVCPDAIRRISEQGFDVWAAPGRDETMIHQWHEALIKQGGSGMLMTNWQKCIPANRESILELVRLAGTVER